MQCVITSEVVKPFPDRPTNGQYSFEVVLSPMADSAFAKEVVLHYSSSLLLPLFSGLYINISFSSRLMLTWCLVLLLTLSLVATQHKHATTTQQSWSEDAVEVCRVMERALRESEAVETESLCVLAGEGERERVCVCVCGCVGCCLM